MSSRDEILELLRRSAVWSPKHADTFQMPHLEDAARLSPAVPRQDHHALAERFLMRLQSVKGEAYRAYDTKSVHETVKALIASWNVKSVAYYLDSPVLDFALPKLLEELKLPTFVLKGGPDEDAWRAELAQAALEQRTPKVPWDLAICGCAGAIAETGTIAHRITQGRGRGGWLLCAAQLVVVNVEQIVPDLEDLFVPGGALDKEDMPRAVTLVTGPSRTADIEQTLTVGVHGPGKFAGLVVG